MCVKPLMFAHSSLIASDVQLVKEAYSLLLQFTQIMGKMEEYNEK